MRWVSDVLRFCDTDMNGHVNNATFAVLCESGRVNLFRGAFGPTRPAESFWVIAKLTIEFKAELHYPGTVRTGTWVSALGRSSMGLAQAILAPDGRLAATAEAVCVSMDGPSRRPAPFDDATRAVAERMLRVK